MKRAPGRRQGEFAGGHDDGGPGLRLQYHRDYYAAFVVDPDGHRSEDDSADLFSQVDAVAKAPGRLLRRIEAVCHAPEKAMIV